LKRLAARGCAWVASAYLSQKVERVLVDLGQRFRKNSAFYLELSAKDADSLPQFFATRSDQHVAKGKDDGAGILNLVIAKPLPETALDVVPVLLALQAGSKALDILLAKLHPLDALIR